MHSLPGEDGNTGKNFKRCDNYLFLVKRAIRSVSCDRQKFAC